MLPLEKLSSLARRFRELEDMLCRPEIVGDRQQFQKLSKERSDLEPIANAFGRHVALTKKLEEDRAAIADPELRELAEMEIPELEAALATLEGELKLLLVPTASRQIVARIAASATSS